MLRKAFHAGSWYSSNRDELQAQIKGFLDASDKSIPEGQRLKAIIGPHAGLRWSGPVAGWAYRNVEPAHFSRVVLLGPSHKVGLDFMATT